MSLFTREALPDAGPAVFRGNDIVDVPITGDTPAGQTGDLLQLKVNGTTKFSVDKDGDITGAAFTPTGNVTIATGKTLTVTDADALTVGGKIIPNTLPIHYSMLANGSLATQVFFVADRAYTVTAAKQIHSVAGTDAGAVTIDVTKDTGTGAPGSGNTVLAGTFNAKSTANTVQTQTPSAVGADILLAAGDRLAVKFTGVLTNLAGVNVTVVLKAS